MAVGREEEKRGRRGMAAGRHVSQLSLWLGLWLRFGFCLWFGRRIGKCFQIRLDRLNVATVGGAVISCFDGDGAVGFGQFLFQRALIGSL